MKRILTFLSVVLLFSCVGMAVFGLIATEALRTSAPPELVKPTQRSVSTERLFTTVIPIGSATPTAVSTQAGLLLVTDIPVPSPLQTNSVGSDTDVIQAVAATLMPVVTLSSYLDATWTGEAHTGATAAAAYQNRWRATLTEWAVEYGLRQQTATAYARTP